MVRVAPAVFARTGTVLGQNAKSLKCFYKKKLARKFFVSKKKTKTKKTVDQAGKGKSSPCKLSCSGLQIGFGTELVPNLITLDVLYFQKAKAKKISV